MSVHVAINSRKVLVRDPVCYCKSTEVDDAPTLGHDKVVYLRQGIDDLGAYCSQTQGAYIFLHHPVSVLPGVIDVEHIVQQQRVNGVVGLVNEYMAFLRLRVLCCRRGDSEKQCQQTENRQLQIVHEFLVLKVFTKECYFLVIFVEII